jgi:HlyD family secretion protein
MLSLLKHPYLLGAAGTTLIGAALAAHATFSSIYPLAILPKEGELTQTVSAPGTVIPIRTADLSFEKAGTLASLNVRVGDKVPSGAVLASLVSGSDYAELLQAKATLAKEQAALEALKQNIRPEEVAVKAQDVDSAKDDLTNAYGAVLDTIRSTDTKISTAIKSTLAPLFVIRGARYVLNISTCDQRLQSTVELERNTLEKTLSTFQQTTAPLSAISDPTKLLAGLSAAYNTATSSSVFLGHLATLLSNQCLSAYDSIDVYRSSLTDAQTSVSTIFSDITDKRKAVDDAQNALDQAQKDLDLLKAGPDPVRIRAQETVVAQAEADVVTAESTNAASILSAPFDGVISKVSLVKGTTVFANKPFISMISSAPLQVEASIPESSIANVAQGNTAHITLTAYRSTLPLDGTVVALDPTATIENGVPVYHALVAFKHGDAKIKAGMSAHVVIVTNYRAKALSLPSSYVKVLSDGVGSIIIVDNEKKEIRKVKLGITDDSGNIEIINGLLSTEHVLPR